MCLEPSLQQLQIQLEGLRIAAAGMPVHSAALPCPLTCLPAPSPACMPACLPPHLPACPPASPLPAGPAGIVDKAADLDVAMVMGMGFPAFRGGLIFWADLVGAGGQAAGGGEVGRVMCGWGDS